MVWLACWTWPLPPHWGQVVIVFVSLPVPSQTRAGLGVPDLDLTFGSGHCLLERDLHPHEQVRAALRPAGRLPPRTAAEECVEDVAEAREVGREPALEPAAPGIDCPSRRS